MLTAADAAEVLVLAKGTKGVLGGGGGLPFLLSGVMQCFDGGQMTPSYLVQPFTSLCPIRKKQT